MIHQEVGETRDAIIEDDNKLINNIVNTNKNIRDPYWIVIFAKPSKLVVNGLPVLSKHIQTYKKKPRSQVGMIIGKVNNIKGTLEWEVNLPQIPFDFDALKKFGAKSCDEFIVETNSIPESYITK